MNYLHHWMADRIAEKVTITSISRPPASDLPDARTAAGAYIAMRTAYGSMHHWPLDADGIDIDEYDHHPHTCYFLAHQKTGLHRRHLSAGLRLTRVDDFDATLSLAMWGHAIDKPHVVAQLIEHKKDVSVLQSAARDGRLWDLTRLVTAMSLQAERPPKLKRATYVALLLLLGAALKYTGKDSYWLFTTNRETRRFLDRLDIRYVLLAQGRISYSDVGESYFAYTSVQQAYEQLKNGQPIVANLVERGYRHVTPSHFSKDSVS